MSYSKKIKIFTLILILFVLYFVFHFYWNNENFYDKTPSDFVFIVTRHVNSETTNKYWKECYKCIRKFYPNVKIVIIDDNSNPDFLLDDGIVLDNVEIIKSEYPGRGELLPYYYFYKNHYADKAVIIHDSVFINQYVDFSKINDNVNILWHFNHYHDKADDEKNIIKQLKNSDKLLEFYDKGDKWMIAFGVMSFIKWDFVVQLQEKYDLFNLLHVIKTRYDRMCLERIFGLLCHIENNNLIENPSLFGPPIFDMVYDKYEKGLEWGETKMIKVFTGR